MSASRSNSSDRLLSTSYYLGLAPLTCRLRRPDSNPLLQHHRAQAMAAFFVLLLLFLMACLFDTAVTILVVGFPDLADRLMARGSSQEGRGGRRLHESVAEVVVVLARHSGHRFGGVHQGVFDGVHAGRARALVGRLHL